ncbi:MAG: filamentous hemagglutinin N-terminal domain-containing protein [Waterburya sp.]
MKISNYLEVISLPTLFICLLLSKTAKAQTIPDNTLPEKSQVTKPQDNTTQIDGGTRTGNNLFHSFEQFSVPTGETAWFNNAMEIENIFSRITGGTISEIDGILKANGDANFFLINPAGIIFGENAALNIGGSFFASTADSINFADGSQFSATNPKSQPLLTVNIPIGLQVGGNPGTITNQSIKGLEVQPGKNLTFLGGNLNLNGGKLTAPGGRVELGSLSAPGEVELNQDGSLSFPDGLARGDISVMNDAVVDVTADGGGFIGVNARNLEMKRGLLLTGIDSGKRTLETQAGDIKINATGTVSLNGESDNNTNTTVINNNVQNEARGNGGNIELTTVNLSVTDGASIDTSLNGEGNAGDIKINATGNISLDGIGESGGQSLLSSGVAGQGNGGDITVNTKNLSISNGASINSVTGWQTLDPNTDEIERIGKGDAGNISIFATGQIVLDGLENQTLTTSIFSFVNDQGEGNAGDIEITTLNLSLLNQAQIDNSVGLDTTGNAGNIQVNTQNLSLRNGSRISNSTFGQGDAGNIDINVAEIITLDGFAEQSNNSGLFSFTDSSGSGGNIEITTKNLLLNNGAVIDSSTSGTGNAGNIKIFAADTVALDGKNRNIATNGISAIAFDNSTGNSGNIDIFAKNFSLANQSVVLVDNLGQGNGGNLTIEANSINLEQEAFISASTESGTGGNVNLKAKDLLMRDRNLISASASENANGGNVNIDADLIVAFPNRNNDITANADQGKGGTIQITTEGILGLQTRKSTPSNQTNDFDASSDAGISGEVNIDSPEVEPDQGLIKLPSKSTTTKVTQLCTADLAKNKSQFIITGRGGFATNPREDLSPDAVQVDWVTFDGRTSTDSSTLSKFPYPQPNPIVEATSWKVNQRGNVVLIANTPNNNPESFWHSPDRCKI